MTGAIFDCVLWVQIVDPPTFLREVDWGVAVFFGKHDF